MTLDELVAVHQRELYLPDPYPLIVVAASYASSRLPGDAVWTMLVGPPSSGKTEILNGLVGLPEVFMLHKITVAGLLNHRSAAIGGGAGGLLAELVASGHARDGVVVSKDFTSILSAASETRAEVLAAFREIYDESWTRRLGTGGGAPIIWEGRITFIGAVTEIIDGRGEDMAQMGHRFILCRMPVLDAVDRRVLGEHALAKAGSEEVLRRKLSRAFRSFAKSLPATATATGIETEARERLVALADFATRCRSSVGRGGYRRELEYLAEPEAPSRVVTQLGQLYRSFRLCGLSLENSLEYVETVAKDMVPPDRLRVLELFVAKKGALSSAYVAGVTRLPTSSIDRVLEDLTMLSVLRQCDDSTYRFEMTRWLKSFTSQIELNSSTAAQP